MKTKYVCVKCGHEVEGECGCPFGGKGFAFCGNCGDLGSHQIYTTADKWIKARKLMGLPAKINDYNN